MQSNDTQRLMDLCPNFHLIWSAPLQIISTSVRADHHAVPTRNPELIAGVVGGLGGLQSHSRS